MLRIESAQRTAAKACRLQPSVTVPCAYHTTSLSQTRSSNPSMKQNFTPLTSHQPQRRRHASTTASPSTTTPSSSNASASIPTPSTHLNWNTFFTLRKSRRRVQLGSSIGSSFLSMAGGAQALAMADMDAIVSQVPLDPFVTLGLITFGAGAGGWLLGPIVGTGIFNVMNRRWVGEMTVKEKEFYARIKQYRVDPSASSMANPVPDYYGEKISSVQGYRQWLKDQRAFNKKRQTFVR